MTKVFDQRSRLSWWVIGLALVARLAVLPLPFVLSDDAYRYLWEGRVQNAGFNPYRYAPDAEELTPLRDDNWQRVAHKEVPTIYSPLVLLVFRLGAALADSPVIFKFIFAGFDLLTLGVLWRWRGSQAWVWALSPLVIIEFAGSGHEMSLAILFVVAGLRRLEEWKDGRVAAVCFAAAILSHLMALPFVLAAVLAARVKSWRFWTVLLAVVAVGYLPFLDAGADLGRGLTHFAGRWQFNGFLFDGLVGLLRDDMVRLVAGDVWISHERTKRVCAGLLAVLLGWVWWRRFEPARAALTMGGAVLLLSPTVHPWYLTWLVALCAVELRWTWLVWSATVLLAYTSGWWPAWRWAEYLPVFAALTWEWSRDSIRRRWSQRNL